MRLPRPPRLALRLLGWGCMLALAGGLVWLGVTALMAQSRLQSIDRELPALRTAISTGDFDTARAISIELQRDASGAHRLSTGPAWWIAANVPGVGEPLRTARAIAAQSDAIASGVLPTLLDLADTLKGTSLRHGSQVDLGVLQKAAPKLAAAASTAYRAADGIQDTTNSSWLESANKARTHAVSALIELSNDLHGASNAVDTVLPMLGGDGTRRYFVGFMNEAESRGLGGLPGAFAIVKTEHGKITFEHFGNDGELSGVRASVDLDSGFLSRYAPDDPLGTYANSDISPNFPYAAQIWTGLWQAKTGQHLDGALAVDPTSLSYLLKVAGAATLPDGSTVDADNVVALTEQQQYSIFADNAQRKNFVVDIARATSHQVLNGGGSPEDLVHAVSKSAGERRLLVWSSTAVEEDRITAAGYGGVLEAGNRAFAGFTVVNAAGTKLDYYLGRAMTYDRASCVAGATATATLKLTNGAPASGLPIYVTHRTHGAGPADSKPGDNGLTVSFYATPGAKIREASLDGKKITVVATEENGLTVISVPVELPVGATRTLLVSYTDPRPGPAELLQQPLVQPMAIDAAPICS